MGSFTIFVSTKFSVNIGKYIVAYMGYVANNKWVLVRMNRFIGSSPVLTKNNYYTIADIHNLQSRHTNLLSLFPLVFTIRFLATDL
jgi:hypothetical protein